MIQPSTTSQQTIDPRRSAPAKGWEIAIIGAACRLPAALADVAVALGLRASMVATRAVRAGVCGAWGKGLQAVVLLPDCVALAAGNAVDCALVVE